MSGQPTEHVRLVQACSRPGCPVCRCLGEESRRHLDALIAEHVTDPDSRRAFREAWGFCNWHTWMLLEVDGSRFGASILCEDLVGRALRLLDEPDVPSGLRSWLVPSKARRRRSGAVQRYERRSLCTVCLRVAESERHHVLTLVRSLRDGAVADAYDTSDGVCVPHLLQAVALTGGTDVAGGLIERTRRKWAAARRDLESFVEKHDYRNRAAFSEADAGSYTRAFEILTGAKGAFGNDLAAARRRTGGR
jgi:hypothetical protein